MPGPGDAGRFGAGGADLQLALSGEGSSSSLSETCQRHSGALPLLKKYLLQYLRDRLQSEHAELYCIPLRRGVLRRLQDTLQTGNSPSMAGHDSDNALQLPGFEVDLDDVLAIPQQVSQASRFGQAAQGVLFFHVVRCFPKKLIRVAAENETGFDSSDIVIAPHRVLHVAAASREVIVDSDALDWVSAGDKQPFVLSLDSFSCEDLLNVFMWSSGETLSYGLWGGLSEAVTGSLRNVLPAVIEDLLSKVKADTYLLDEHRPETAGWKDCLNSMADAGLVDMVSSDARFSKWALREKGLQRMKAGYRLKNPVQLCGLRNDVAVSERSVWELMLSLDLDGWTHVVKKKANDPPYVPGSTPKVWYSRPGDNAVSSWYLLALLQDCREVPHWQAAGHYEAVVEGRLIPQRGCRRKALAIKQTAEDAWDIPAMADEAPKPKPGAKRRRTVAPLPAPNALEAIDNIAVAHPEPDDEAAEDEALQMLLEAEEPDDSECNTSSSSSSSSQSSSSSSSDDSDSSDEPAAPAKAKAPSKPKGSRGRQAPTAERAVNPRAGFRYGLGYAVRVYKAGEAVGYEMSCGHPCHDDGKCRKNLKGVTKQGTEADTVNLLKVWLIRGRHSLSAKEHMQEIWSEVERDFKQGQLEIAPEDPPLNYTDREGRSCVFTPR